ncbi:hypothetical protein LS482_14315 [Sinomicrobium kalidii]|uniref:hypothetical protein n=1 Tax=Sinomicrobium kalidii TaxID=2900738 RepID=UPI001E297423|nr:hypothetical protein [Sinomicrobium kalidii]UGU14864.1 hypothetical protein LS482_14315 [Sinomicrobium kalidii]
MGHDNFEHRLKQKLEERRITPSSAAWDRLGKDLDSASQARSRRSFLLYGVAASVVVLITAGIWFLRDGEKENVPVVTDVRIETKQQERKKVKMVREGKEAPVTIKTPQVKPESGAVPLVKTPETNKTISLPDTVRKEPVKAPEKAEEMVAFEDKKVEEVVSRIMAIQEEREVTDEEIEFLLAEAREEIDAQRILVRQTGTIDATALLEEVESELDQSFRDKVFEALKDGFKKVRTAVANRNQ